MKEPSCLGKYDVLFKLKVPEGNCSVLPIRVCCRNTFMEVGVQSVGKNWIWRLLKLFIWLLNRSTRRKEPKKILTAATDQNGSQVNFYYGAPTPYAESIAPSHHSTYAHYYDDEEDGWEMPNFYNETYMKGSWRKTDIFQI